MAKPHVRKRGGVWRLHDGMLTRPTSSWAAAHQILAARLTTRCLHEGCHRQRADNPYGVCAEHAPQPAPSRTHRNRVAQLERRYLYDAA